VKLEKSKILLTITWCFALCLQIN